MEYEETQQPTHSPQGTSVPACPLNDARNCDSQLPKEPASTVACADVSEFCGMWSRLLSYR